ncbi:unnamed protein product [Sphagnum balticum]
MEIGARIIDASSGANYMQPQPDAGEYAIDKIDEVQMVNRPQGLENVLDKQSIHILESLDLEAFDNLYNAFESFLSDAPLFAGDTSFAKAAMALDATANLFSQMDQDDDHLLGKSELEYLLQSTTSDNVEALRWLVDHFDAFTGACFFQDKISCDDLESARNVFHGLKFVHEKFGFNEEATPETVQHLNAIRIENYLSDNRDHMEAHDVAGLEQLLAYIEEHAAKR